MASAFASGTDADADAVPARLPRGRHGLSRQQVADSQRRRILLAVAETMADKGYVASTVADVLKAAGVSRETFYQQFSSKQDAFMAAFDAAGELAVAALGDRPPDQAPRSTTAPVSTPIDRFEAALTGYLATLADQPAFARTFLVEVYAAGPEALARRAAFQRRVVDAMVGDLGFGEAHRFACELVVAATAALVTPLVVTGDLEGIEALGPRIVEALTTLVS